MTSQYPAPVASSSLRHFARQTAQQHGLDPDIFERQIDQESGFNPNAVSPAGAQGIAQFMPGTAASVGLTNPFDPMASLVAAAKLMSQYVQQFGSIEDALVAYNAGPGNVGKPLPEETQHYLRSITGTIGSKREVGSNQQRALIDALRESMDEFKPNPQDFMYQGLDGKPQLDSESYQAAIGEYIQNQQMILEMSQSLDEEEAGIFRMEDGQIITREMMDQLDPAARAQVEATIANRNIERQNQFNDLLNSLDLTEFTTGQQSTQLENQRRSQDFQNQLESFRQRISLDQANQDTAVKKIDRNLMGMQESRARATDALDALMKAAPFGTSNGKTSFTPADLGGAVSALARFGGIGANTPLLNFTGVQTIDPNSMFNFYDQQLGVGGPLPEIPNLTTQPGQIPAPPSSVPIQLGSPTFRRPQAPVDIPAPQATPAPLPQIGQDLTRSILGMFGGLLGS